MNRLLHHLRPGLVATMLLLGTLNAGHTAGTHPDMLIIVGASGTPEYELTFAQGAKAIEQAAHSVDVSCTVLGSNANDSKVEVKTQVEDWLASMNAAGGLPLWIFYLGHGTWDGEQAWLNLSGPDLSASELSHALEGYSRPVVFVHGGSASGPFIPALSRQGRIIVTATESGDEVNYARFGAYFAEALASPAADIDQDGRTSLLEAFAHAGRESQDFYLESGRLATEHAMIDDNGDGKGTPLDWFHGTRVKTKSEEGSPDGALARRLALVESPNEQRLTGERRAERDRLESALETLRQRKSATPPEEYLRELEILLRKLAHIYAAPDGTHEGDT